MNMTEKEPSASMLVFLNFDQNPSNPINAVIKSVLAKTEFII